MNTRTNDPGDGPNCEPTGDQGCDTEPINPEPNPYDGDGTLLPGATPTTTTIPVDGDGNPIVPTPPTVDGDGNPLPTTTVADVVTTTAQPEPVQAFTGGADTLPATGSESALLVVAVAACAFGVSLRRVARR